MEFQGLLSHGISAELNIEDVTDGLRKLETEMRREVDVTSVCIPGDWLQNFLKEVNLKDSIYKQIIFRAKKDASEAFTTKSAERDQSLSDFCDIDDESSTVIGHFFHSSLKTKLHSKEIVRFCEIFTKYIGKFLYPVSLCGMTAKQLTEVYEIRSNLILIRVYFILKYHCIQFWT